MTRGREDNVAHLVAETVEKARKIWNATLGRDRADLGPANAAQRAAEDVERHAPHRPLSAALADLRAAWKAEQDLHDAIGRTTRRRDAMAAYGEPAADRVAEINTDLDELRGELDAAAHQVRTRLHEPVMRTLPVGRVEQERPTGSNNAAAPTKQPVSSERHRRPHAAISPPPTTAGRPTPAAGSADEDPEQVQQRDFFHFPRAPAERHKHQRPASNRAAPQVSRAQSPRAGFGAHRQDRENIQSPTNDAGRR